MNKNTLQHKLEAALSAVLGSNQRLRFLCHHHHDWVYFNSQEALEKLDQIQIKGEILMEHLNWAQALPLFGCAWETSEILLQVYGGDKPILVNRFACLAVMINVCLERLGQKECAELVCRQTLSILAMTSLQMEQGTENYNYLMDCMEQLKHPENFKLYVPSEAKDAAVNVLH